MQASLGVGVCPMWNPLTVEARIEARQGDFRVCLVITATWPVAPPRPSLLQSRRLVDSRRLPQPHPRR